jgi:hypothetical protein
VNLAVCRQSNWRVGLHVDAPLLSSLRAHKQRRQAAAAEPMSPSSSPTAKAVAAVVHGLVAQTDGCVVAASWSEQMIVLLRQHADSWILSRHAVSTPGALASCREEVGSGALGRCALCLFRPCCLLSLIPSHAVYYPCLL